MLFCLQEMSQRLCMDDVDDTEGCDIDHPKHVSEQRVNNMTVIELDLVDPLITPHSKCKKGINLPVGLILTRKNNLALFIDFTFLCPNTRT